MPSDPVAIGQRAFSTDSRSTPVVRYQAHIDAVRFAHATVGDPRGAGLLVGPEGSGKSVVAKSYARSLPGGVAVAIVDACGLRPEDLLKKCLAQFGHVTDLESADELVRLLDVFAVQQTRSAEAPIIIVENVDRALPATLRAINLLATLSMQGRPTLRFLLTSSRRLPRLFENKRMAAIAGRLAATFELKPMTPREAVAYLHSKLEAVGMPVPDDLFPVDACERLHEAASGWPGALDTAALAALGEKHAATATEPGKAATIVKAQRAADRARPGATPPSIIVSRNGDVVQEYTFAERKVLIGRSEFADIAIADTFASKLHALLLLYSDALVLLDLNSANGTTVNSVRVSSTILDSGDIISIGHHRLKVQNAPKASASRHEQLSIADTSKMKSLAEMRKIRKLRLVKSADRGQGRG